MSKGIKITVTKTDIKNGKPGNTILCPIALAVKRATRCKDISVGGTRIMIFNDRVKHGTGNILSMPQKATDFIDAFDWSEPVKPFSFVAKPY